MMESFIVSVVDVILIKDMQTYREWNMFSAAANGRCDIMKKLIVRGCDVNAKDSKGYTALYHAIIHDQTVAFDLLLKHGCWDSLGLKMAIHQEKWHFINSLITGVSMHPSWFMAERAVKEGRNYVGVQKIGGEYVYINYFHLSFESEYYYRICLLILNNIRSLKAENEIMQRLLSELIYSNGCVRERLWSYIKLGIQNGGEINVSICSIFTAPITFMTCARKQKNNCMVDFLGNHGAIIDASKENIKSYNKAVEGNSDAQYQLGDKYYNGDGVQQSYERAALWYAKSAAQQNSWGEFNLAKCFQYGHGVEQSFKKAKEWYAKAAAQGNEWAQKSYDSL